MLPFRISLQLKLAVVLTLLVMLVVGGGAIVHRERLLDNYVPVLAENQEALARAQAAMLGEEAQHALAVLEASAKTLQGHDFSRPPNGSLPGLAGAGALFDLLVLATPDGTLTYLSTRQPTALGLSVSDRDYFQRALKSDRAVVGEPVRTKVTGEPALPMAVAVRDAQGRVQGVVGGRLSLLHTNVLSALARTMPGQGGHFELVTTGPKPVYLVHPDASRLFTSVVTAQAEVNVRDRAAMSEVLSHPETPVVAMQPVPGMPWAVRVVQPAGSALAPVVIMKNRTVPAVALFALAAGVVTWFSALYLLAPLRRVHRAVSRLALNPDAAVRMGRLPRDEVGDLGDEFTRLMERVRQRETELAMTQAAAPLGIFRTNPQGQVVEANDAYRRKLGLETDAVLQDWLELVEPEHRDAARESWLEAQAACTEFRRTVAVCRADGRKAFLVIRTAPIRVSGRIIGHTGTMADVTRRVAEERAQQMLTAVFDATPELVVQHDPEGNVTYMNPAARRFGGLPDQVPLEGLHISQFLPARVYREGVERVFPHAARHGMWLGDSCVRRADGTEMPVSHLVIAHRDAEGRVERYSGVMRDISRAKAAELALRKSEAQLQLVADNLPALMYLVDADERFVFANRAFEHWLGRRPEDVVGRKLEDVFGREAMAIVRPNLVRALAGESVVYERVVQTLGGPIPVQAQVRPHRDTAGDVAGLLVLLSDVSEQKRAAEALRASEERLRSVADQLPMRVAYVDAQQRYQFNNAASVLALGRTLEELKGATVREVLGHDAYAPFEPYIARALQGETVQFEREINDAKGYRHEGVTYLPQRDSEGSHVLGFVALIADGTSQKLKEQRLLRMAQVDNLTGLHNRAGFDEHLSKAIGNCRTHTSTVALLYLDIDKFKSINDTYGHQVGDGLLKQFAQRLTHVCRATDVVTRLGGDEFTVLMERVADAEAADIVGNKVVDAMREPFMVDGHEITATTSVGIALYAGGPGVTSKLLVERADKLLYAAKREGRNGFQVGWVTSDLHMQGQPIEVLA